VTSSLPSSLGDEHRDPFFLRIEKGVRVTTPLRSPYRRLRTLFQVGATHREQTVLARSP
jgi:hypothetical protein